MPAPENRFKSALMRGERLIGCWAGFAERTVHVNANLNVKSQDLLLCDLSVAI